MLKQAIREMETMIESATGGAARAIAGERLLARDLSDHERKASRWKARAEKAVEQGDDDLARQAIARAHEHEAMAEALRRAANVGGANSPGPARSGRRNARQAGRGPAKLESLSARRQLAETGRALRGMAVRSSQKSNGFARFDRMHRQIEQAEAEADALGELYKTAEWTWRLKPRDRAGPPHRGRTPEIKARIGTSQTSAG